MTDLTTDRADVDAGGAVLAELVAAGEKDHRRVDFQVVLVQAHWVVGLGVRG